MSGSKRFDRVAVIVTALTLPVTILFMNGASLGVNAMARTMGYENRLFDNARVHTIDIVMDDWDEFIANATDEEYYAANVVIDGESYKNVGIRAKGNTSLSTVATLGSERYSFKIEFDHYDKSKSYYGLDKLSLNNLIQDSTMMKDYLTYTLMNEFGVNCSLCSYVYITVNGEDWGLYLAVEGVEEAFLQRNYGSDYGELYKPDSMSFGGGRGNGKGFDINDFDFGAGSADDSNAAIPSGSFDQSRPADNNAPGMPASADAEQPANSEQPASAEQSAETDHIPAVFDQSAEFGGRDMGNMGDMGSFGGGFGMGSADVKLQYIDDDPDSYSNIWENAKTDITESDQNRLIGSLKKLSSNEDIASVVDVDQVVRYFVVHNYVCNGDSYTGSMIHNYYLYENDGKLAMIPWDYNLAYGTFQGNNAGDVINTPIDSPIDNGLSDDRPMWSWIVDNEEYSELYHRYFAEFLNGVDIDGIIENAYALIRDYVAKDPTAFYSAAEFELGVKTLRQFCTLRSESICMQLENNETVVSMDYVDVSSITLSDMGSMGGGTVGANEGVPGKPDSIGGFGGMQPGNGQTPDSAAAAAETETPEASDFSPDSTADSAQADMPNGFAGNMPGGFDPSNLPDDFDGNFPSRSSDIQSADDSGEDADNDRTYVKNIQAQDGDFSFDMNGSNFQAENMTAWIWIAVSVIALAVGLIVAKVYKG